MNKPLEGIKVVELGTYIAVPKAARVLADWGAEVIKVESTHGDDWREMGRNWNVTCKPDNNPIFESENANKRDIAVNLKTPEGEAIMMRLLADADIFLTNIRHKGLKKLGLDYESLKDKFPKLIVATISGYGEAGPAKDAPGFDSSAFWGRSGLLVEWCPAGNTPIKPHPGLGDGTTSNVLLSGILAALYSRTKTGRGDLVYTSLYATALWVNSNGVVMGQPKYGIHYPKKTSDLSSAYAAIYQTKDGDFLMLAPPPWHKTAPTVFKALGLDEYLDDPTYMVVEETRTHMDEVVGVLQKAIGGKTTSEVVAILKEADVVHTILTNPRDVTLDSQAWENGYFRRVTLEDGDEIVLANPPLRFDSVDVSNFHLAPRLGEHSREILEQLGYTDKQVSKLAEKGIIIFESPSIS